jgi:hypothetical protein
VLRAFRWDSAGLAEVLNCANPRVNADGLCRKWYYSAWGRGCLGDFLGIEPKVAQSRELATFTTGGVGAPVTLAEDVGWAAV